MENIDNMGKNSLDSLMRTNLTDKEQKKLRNEILRGAVAIVSLVVGIVFSIFAPENLAVSALFYTIGFFVQGIPVFISAIQGIRAKELKNSMEILVAIAIVACYCTGELVLSVLIPLILNLAHFLEERSIIGGREVIDGLRKMNQDTAVLWENGEEKSVEAKSLKVGQIIVVKAGACIPIDGIVTDGDAHIDQKSLTGEPQPVHVFKNEQVYAGTVNLDGRILVKVEKEYVDTSFSKILSLLEESENISIPESRLIDRFMKYYIPFILVVAAVVALITMDISKAIAILVASCPCGQMLVTSAPMIASLSAAIKKGILIKNSKFIEELTEIDAVVFDKTGTVTKGELAVTDVLAVDGVSREFILEKAAALSTASTHPIARAVSAVKKSEEKVQVKEIAGKGMEGVSADGKIILFGNKKLLEEAGVSIPENFGSDLIGSVSYVSENGELLGCVCFNDTVREEAKESVIQLRALGSEKITILTGDRKAAAEYIGKQIGADNVESQLLPMDKFEKLKAIKEDHCVLAVGDGINDALALKEADVGIAMGAMGSDLAIQSADIALMNNNLENIPFVIRLAKRTRSIIYQNLVLSCVISLIMILLSAFGVISALVGAILHNAGAFSVLINSSRILRAENQIKK